MSSAPGTPHDSPLTTGRFSSGLYRLLVLPMLWLLLTILGSFTLLWNVAALPLNLLLPPRAATRVGRCVIAFGYRVYWWLVNVTGLAVFDARALDAVRNAPGGLIIAANHPSMLDAMFIAARLPRSVCIMKSALMRNPLINPAARLARYISNASAQDMMRRAIFELQSGNQLVLFPEGTRTVHGRLNRFGPGVSLIARRAGVPIQTVIIDAQTPYGGKHWPLWRLPPLPAVIQLRLGRRFEPQEDHLALLAALETYFRQELES